MDAQADGSYDTGDDAARATPADDPVAPVTPGAAESGEQGGWAVECAQLKEEGNTLFKAAEYEGALKRYREAVNLVPSGTLTHDVRTLGAAVNNNTAAALFKLQRWGQAQLYASNALVLDPRNAKALHRRGQALAQQGKHAKAAADFRAALKLTGAADVASEKAIRKALREAMAALARKESDGGGDDDGADESKGGGGAGPGNEGSGSSGLPKFSEQPAPASVTAGGCAEFRVVAAKPAGAAYAAHPLRYRWKGGSDGAALRETPGRFEGVSTPVLRVLCAEEGDAGQYRCAVFAGAAAESKYGLHSDAAALTVTLPWTRARAAAYARGKAVDFGSYLLWQVLPAMVLSLGFCAATMWVFVAFPHEVAFNHEVAFAGGGGGGAEAPPVASMAAALVPAAVGGAAGPSAAALPHGFVPAAAALLHEHEHSEWGARISAAAASQPRMGLFEYGDAKLGPAARATGATALLGAEDGRVALLRWERSAADGGGGGGGGGDFFKLRSVDSFDPARLLLAGRRGQGEGGAGAPKAGAGAGPRIVSVDMAALDPSGAGGLQPAGSPGAVAAAASSWRSVPGRLWGAVVGGVPGQAPATPKKQTLLEAAAANADFDDFDGEEADDAAGAAAKSGAAAPVASNGAAATSAWAAATVTEGGMVRVLVPAAAKSAPDGAADEDADDESDAALASLAAELHLGSSASATSIAFGGTVADERAADWDASHKDDAGGVPPPPPPLQLLLVGDAAGTLTALDWDGRARLRRRGTVSAAAAATAAARAGTPAARPRGVASLRRLRSGVAVLMQPPQAAAQGAAVAEADGEVLLLRTTTGSGGGNGGGDGGGSLKAGTATALAPLPPLRLSLSPPCYIAGIGGGQSAFGGSGGMLTARAFAADATAEDVVHVASSAAAAAPTTSDSAPGAARLVEGGAAAAASGAALSGTPGSMQSLMLVLRRRGGGDQQKQQQGDQFACEARPVWAPLPLGARAASGGVATAGVRVHAVRGYVLVQPAAAPSSAAPGALLFNVSALGMAPPELLQEGVLPGGETDEGERGSGEVGAPLIAVSTNRCAQGTRGRATALAAPLTRSRLLWLPAPLTHRTPSSALTPRPQRRRRSSDAGPWAQQRRLAARGAAAAIPALPRSARGQTAHGTDLRGRRGSHPAAHECIHSAPQAPQAEGGAGRGGRRPRTRLRTRAQPRPQPRRCAMRWRPLAARGRRRPVARVSRRGRCCHCWAPRPDEARAVALPARQCR